MPNSKSLTTRLFPFLGLIVGVAVVGVFLTIAIMATINSNQPPRQADVAPTSQPSLVCVPAASQGSPTSSTNVSSGTGAASDNAGSTPSPTASTGPKECADGQDYFAPQYRGSFDPSSRYLALLAIITPLVTTLVAFYFGEKAGAAKGEAESRSLAGRTAAININDPEALQQLEKFQQELKDGGKL